MLQQRLGGPSVPSTLVLDILSPKFGNTNTARRTTVARIARVVASGCPHHVTQRGNRRQQTFFSDDDYREYLRLMSASCARTGTEVWAYCLMPNHVHLIMVPQHSDGLRSAISERSSTAGCGRRSAVQS